VKALHFRVAKEPRRYTWPRVLCGARGRRKTGGWRQTLELREKAVVTCPTCLVIKDLWLTEGTLKPLTIRRARALLVKQKNFPHP
jgi:hypothetical protein